MKNFVESSNTNTLAREQKLFVIALGALLKSVVEQQV